MSNNKIYLAYGSDINTTHMEQHCLDAEPIGTTELHGYALCFRGDDGRAAATLEQSEGSVPALLWEISPDDEQELDHCANEDYAFRKETATVVHNGTPIDVFFYVIDAAHDFGAPSYSHYSTIEDGYSEAGFNTDTLRKSLANCCDEAVYTNYALYSKFSENYESLKDEWYSMKPRVLVELAESIALANSIYDEALRARYTTQLAQQLLRYKNPLSIALEASQLYEYPVDEDFITALETVIGDDYYTSEYTLDPKFAEPEMEM